eukprot:CAMPEP_0169259364 /NCGR_PEP_ID=MMETSP1016-20121227/41931_1 /TAXON_ID=342587 /ORGANISM="Karlodinium micrum, Strain CCMP2283" /LENGTH=240 /DNA_ID=CAMNT_0009341411 /DNA_START=156 /DNA_END=879 /DNA_ORIENTATION=+
MPASTAKAFAVQTSSGMMLVFKLEWPCPQLDMLILVGAASCCAYNSSTLPTANATASLHLASFSLITAAAARAPAAPSRAAPAAADEIAQVHALPLQWILELALVPPTLDAFRAPAREDPHWIPEAARAPLSETIKPRSLTGGSESDPIQNVFCYAALYSGSLHLFLYLGSKERAAAIAPQGLSSKRICLMILRRESLFDALFEARRSRKRLLCDGKDHTSTVLLLGLLRAWILRYGGRS